MKYYIDTNTLIHYTLFSNIDWCREFNEKEVTLIICDTVINELDQLKFTGKTIDIQNRARKVLSKFNEYKPLGEKERITKNVNLKLTKRKSNFNWDEYNLDKSSADDRIIATIISNNDLDVTLVTSDTGMKLKCQIHEIKFSSLSDVMRLKQKVSKEEKEISELKKKLVKFEYQHPKLKLKYREDKKDTGFMNFQIERVPLAESELESKLKTIYNDLKYTPKPKKNESILYQDLANWNKPTQEEIDRYNDDLNIYIKDMRNYLNDLSSYENTLSRMIEFNFCITNDGYAPAHDIEVQLHFPNGFILYKKENLPKAPKIPSEPVSPRTVAEIAGATVAGISMGINAANLHNLNSYNLPTAFKNEIQPNMGPFIKKTNSYDVSYNIGSLNHNYVCQLNPIYLIFDTYESAKSFEVEYRIFASNYPELFEGNIKVIINKT